jgi:hypothetical protein
MFYENPQGVSVHDGFPNPATDASLQTLDLNKLLIKNGVSTYFMRIAGDDWRKAGIFDGDVAVIDRAVAPRRTDLVIWCEGSDFMISPRHALPIGKQMWGVVTSVIHMYREVPHE